VYRLFGIKDKMVILNHDMVLMTVWFVFGCTGYSSSAGTRHCSQKLHEVSSNSELLSCTGLIMIMCVASRGISTAGGLAEHGPC